MDIHPSLPRVFHVLEGQALEVRSGPYGAVGTLFSGEGLEAVWVSKQNEAIDSDWFSQDGVDMLVVLQGQLRIEFANPDFPPCLLQLGDVLVLAARTACRAYRWPRDAEQGTVFLAVYPQHVSSAHQGKNRVAKPILS
jgi:hypothetical protein